MVTCTAPGADIFGSMVHTEPSICFILLGTASVKVNPEITNVGIDTYYSCTTQETLTGNMVNQTLWNVIIQAFVNNGSLSKNGMYTWNH